MEVHRDEWMGKGRIKGNLKNKVFLNIQKNCMVLNHDLLSFVHAITGTVCECTFTNCTALNHFRGHWGIQTIELVWLFSMAPTVQSLFLHLFIYNAFDKTSRKDIHFSIKKV